MLVYYIMIKEKITENKKEYYKNYRLKNREKLLEYQRHYYHTKKNNEIDRINKIENDIKIEIEKLKENFRLLYVDHEDLDITIIITIFPI